MQSLLDKPINFLFSIFNLIISEWFFSPSVFVHDLSFFLWGEIVFNIEEFSCFLNGFSFDEGGNFSARKFKERLNIHEVSSKDQFEKNLLFKINKISEPFTDDVTKLVASKWFLNLWGGVIVDISAVLDNLI